jgi:hypothetical protein
MNTNRLQRDSMTSSYTAIAAANRRARSDRMAIEGHASHEGDATVCGRTECSLSRAFYDAPRRLMRVT